MNDHRRREPSDRDSGQDPSGRASAAASRPCLDDGTLPNPLDATARARVARWLETAALGGTAQLAAGPDAVSLTSMRVDRAEWERRLRDGIAWLQALAEQVAHDELQIRRSSEICSLLDAADEPDLAAARARLDTALTAAAPRRLATYRREVEMRARVHTLLCRLGTPRSSQVRVGALDIDLTTRTAAVNGRAVALTETEFVLLRMLASAPTRVFSKEELLLSLWGDAGGGETRKVDAHACRLRRKLARDGDRFVINVWALGYRLVDGLPHRGETTGEHGLKQHTHDGVDVEIRPGAARVLIRRARPTDRERNEVIATSAAEPRRAGDRDDDLEAAARSVAALLGSLTPDAEVTVTIGHAAAPAPSKIAQAVHRAAAFGGDLPNGVPACGRLIELPWTEVCMHLGIAGRLRWVAPVNDRLAQVYDPPAARSRHRSCAARQASTRRRRLPPATAAVRASNSQGRNQSRSVPHP